MVKRWRRQGLKSLLLRFRSTDAETGFLLETSKTYASSMTTIIILGLLIWTVHFIACLTVPHMMNICGHDMTWLTLLRTALGGVEMVLYAAFLAILVIPGIRKKFSPSSHETMAMIIMMQTMVVVCIFDPAFTSLFSGGRACFDRRLTGAKTYLKVVTVVVILHFAVPVRWCKLIFMEGLMILLQLGCSVGLGGISQSETFMWCFIFMFVMILGKRRLERTERLLFRQFLAEKTLRTQAEFKLSCLQPTRSGEWSTGSEGESLPSSTPTGVAFASINEEGAPVQQQEQLLTVVAIGHREQWLLGEEDVELVDSGTVSLGSGGNGLVVAGFFNGTPAAIKFPQADRRGLSLADIGNELRILRKLKHPNIVSIFGAVVDSLNRDIALVLELVRGETMTDFIGGKTCGGRLPSSGARCQCLLGICRALHYLHSRNPQLVHGDLKPSNIMIERLQCVRGATFVNAKLLDFGLARVLTRRAKPLGGTVRWMAPELLTQLACKPNQAADLFSFGCLLFFTAVGQAPLEEMRQDRIQALKRRGRSPPLRWPCNVVPLDQCRMLADHLTRVNPEERPSMAQIHQQLLQWPEVRQVLASEVGHMPVFLATDSAAAADGEVPQTFWMQLRQVRATASPLGRSQSSLQFASSSVAPSMVGGATAEAVGIPDAVARGIDAMNDLELAVLAQRHKQAMPGLAEHAEGAAVEEFGTEILEEREQPPEGTRQCLISL